MLKGKAFFNITFYSLELELLKLMDFKSYYKNNLRFRLNSKV